MFGKRLYDSAPVFLQSAAVSALGWAGRGQKYGSAFHEWMKRLTANEQKSRGQLLEDQSNSIRQLLRYARKRIPYYRDLRNPGDDIAAWPILEKHTIAADLARFVSDEFRPSSLLVQKTSGTTGTPLQVWLTRGAYQTEMAFRWRHRAWAGIPFLSRGAYLSGHAVVPAKQNRPPFWRVDRGERRILFSSYHLSPETIPSYVEALQRFAPDFVHGYPSSLYLIARHILNRGMPPVSTRAVFCASETLLDYQRETIETSFGSKAFNWYGNTELTCNIVECARGRLHYRTDYGYMEVSEDGSIIVTGLNNPAMPLIRYRVGDHVCLGSGGCQCGRGFPLVERIEGRQEDYIETSDGRLVGRLDHVFKGVDGVQLAQLVQRTPGDLTVRIVRAPEYGPETERRIAALIRERLGHGVRFQFDYVDRIDRTPSGKFRFVVTDRPGAGEVRVPAAVWGGNDPTD